MLGLECPYTLRGGCWVSSGYVSWGLRRKVPKGHQCAHDRQDVATWVLAPCPSSRQIASVTSLRALASAPWLLLPGLLCLDFCSVDSSSPLKTCSKSSLVCWVPRRGHSVLFSHGTLWHAWVTAQLVCHTVYLHLSPCELLRAVAVSQFLSISHLLAWGLGTANTG